MGGAFDWHVIEHPNRYLTVKRYADDRIMDSSTVAEGQEPSPHVHEGVKKVLALHRARMNPVPDDTGTRASNLEIDKAMKESDTTWMGRPIHSSKDVHGLEAKAAVNEFVHGIDRRQAEQKAYDEYVRGSRLDAVRHHARGAKLANAAGDKEAATKHAVMIAVHAQALGQDPAQAIEDAEIVGEEPKAHKFRAHPADLFALTK